MDDFIVKVAPITRKFERIVSVEEPGVIFYIALSGRWRGLRMNNTHIGYLNELKSAQSSREDGEFVQEIIDSIPV